MSKEMSKEEFKAYCQSLQKDPAALDKAIEKWYELAKQQCDGGKTDKCDQVIIHQTKQYQGKDITPEELAKIKEILDPQKTGQISLENYKKFIMMVVAEATKA